MSDARARARNDTSGSKRTNGNGMLPGRASLPLLNGEHPPLVEHVNGCDDCLAWLMLYMTSVFMAKRRGNHGKN